MYHIRKTKTASGATAVQVVKYVRRKLSVVAHIGSAHNSEELKTLQQIAVGWIEKQTRQKSLLPLPVDNISSVGLSLVEKCEYLGIRYAFIYEILRKLLARFQFTCLGNKLLNDLVIMRIMEPVSKLQSLELLQEYFGISHRRQFFYESLPKMVKLKRAVEQLTSKLAITEFGLDFSLIFYDVTTLYFESFQSDDLRKPGFSKDNKPNQPQIVIGLVVSKDGFPIAYEIFAGNKFEGHTLIPVIESFKSKHSIKTLTVVADAAMISMDNIQALKQRGLQYIVGARMGNLPLKLIDNISHLLNQRDGATMRVATVHGDLVCDFSLKRYRKDKREMDKQIEKAQRLVNNSSGIKRAKFLQVGNKNTCAINQELIEKTKLILGIKGYCTNLGEAASNQTIIDHYHSLWRVEQAFRIAKNDLQMRPMFHFKEDAIKVHVLICFMALAISKYLEIKTATPLQQIIKAFKQVTDARLLDTLAKKEIIMRTKIPENTKMLLQRLNLPY